VCGIVESTSDLHVAIMRRAVFDLEPWNQDVRFLVTIISFTRMPLMVPIDSSSSPSLLNAASHVHIQDAMRYVSCKTKPPRLPWELVAQDDSQVCSCGKKTLLNCHSLYSFLPVLSLVHCKTTRLHKPQDNIQPEEIY